MSSIIYRKTNKQPAETEEQAKARCACRIDGEPPRVTYPILFWLFMGGSLLGVVLEGLWCLVVNGRWQTHVVSIWGPFCIIYGIGAVIFYLCAAIQKTKNIAVQFLTAALLTSSMEYACGILLKDKLHMKAWDYSHNFLNINGLVCLKMTIAWGVAAVIFRYFFVPRAEPVFKKMQTKRWNAVCIVLSLFMAVNLAATDACLLRWSDRHEGITAKNRIEQMIDRNYDDQKMAKIFCEWSFIDSGVQS